MGVTLILSRPLRVPQKPCCEQGSSFLEALSERGGLADGCARVASGVAKQIRLAAGDVTAIKIVLRSSSLPGVDGSLPVCETCDVAPQQSPDVIALIICKF